MQRKSRFASRYRIRAPIRSKCASSSIAGKSRPAMCFA
jgi:hypothetical protein